MALNPFKSLKDGRVLIEAGTPAEIALLSTSVTDKCRKDLEVTVPKLRKPRMIIHNVPQDVTIENLQETVLAQNRELGLVLGDIKARFKFRTEWVLDKMVIKVSSETRKRLLHTINLKIGWLICNVDYYLVMKRCFKCSRFNHRHQD